LIANGKFSITGREYSHRHHARSNPNGRTKATSLKHFYLCEILVNEGVKLYLKEQTA